MKNDKKHLLVVEDDKGLQSQLRWAFDGFEVAVSGDRAEALALFRRLQPGVVLLDLGLPPDPGGVTEGMATLSEILSLTPETKIIVVTGDDDRGNAVKCIALGAYDFHQKPVDAELLALLVNRAQHVYQLERENRRLQTSEANTPLKGIIAMSPQMLKVCRTIEKVAPSDITTLLLGASGTGKERCAQALHNLSSRADGPLVTINCAAIPENLLESELFGYEKGAFTGAAKQTPGKIEYADKGTLFLDEIGDLPMELQSKLLRFLQERVVERIGGRKEIPVDVRIVCATHQDLQTLIANGLFREDLFYRISELVIEIPRLKDREGDVLLLAKSFLKVWGTQYKSSAGGFSQEAIHAIESHDWPGNVRELESRVKRAAIMADSNQIAVEDLELNETESEPLPLNLRAVREEAERRAVLRALNHSDQNVSDAAISLGVTRPTLYNLMEKLGLKV
ncbi:MAG: PEP-CTERM-box response regulator transcription factor [Halieaceae bacterium]|nr:PEP-CTERM-box response regulator transcription factor [Halieaceae bacterium]